MVRAVPTNFTRDILSGGNVIRQVKQLKSLGAKTNKSLPANLLMMGRQRSSRHRKLKVRKREAGL